MPFNGPGPGRPKGGHNRVTLRQREFAEMILGVPGSPEFDEYIASQRKQLLNGSMPPAIHQTLLYFSAGKPTERIEVKDTTTDITDITAEELRARALALASRIIPDEELDVTVN